MTNQTEELAHYKCPNPIELNYGPLGPTIPHFIVFEGTPCSGKSTALQRWYDNFELGNLKVGGVTKFRDPWSGLWSERLSRSIEDSSPSIQGVIYTSNRAYLSGRILGLNTLCPDLIIACDRWQLSTDVFQGSTNSILRDFIVHPGLTLVFTCDYDTYLKRAEHDRKTTGKDHPYRRLSEEKFLEYQKKYDRLIPPSRENFPPGTSAVEIDTTGLDEEETLDVTRDNIQHYLENLTLETNTPSPEKNNNQETDE